MVGNAFRLVSIEWLKFATTVVTVSKATDLTVADLMSQLWNRQ